MGGTFVTIRPTLWFNHTGWLPYRDRDQDWNMDEWVVWVYVEPFTLYLNGDRDRQLLSPIALVPVPVPVLGTASGTSQASTNLHDVIVCMYFSFQLNHWRHSRAVVSTRAEPRCSTRSSTFSRRRWRSRRATTWTWSPCHRGRSAPNWWRIFCNSHVSCANWVRVRSYWIKANHERYIFFSLKFRRNYHWLARTSRLLCIKNIDRNVKKLDCKKQLLIKSVFFCSLNVGLGLFDCHWGCIFSVDFNQCERAFTHPASVN